MSIRNSLTPKNDLQCGTMSRIPSAAPGVRVLHKTLNILEALRRRPSGAGLADVSRDVSLPKPTVYRILATLESRGYLYREPAGAYRLSRKLYESGAVPIDQALVEVARPVMERLVTSCKETVNLGVLDAAEVLVIETVESPQAVRMTSKKGNRRTLHSTALGKVLLAGMAEKEIIRIVRVKGLPRITQNTIVNETALLAEIRLVRNQGYAVDDQEQELDGRCIASAITGPNGRIVAALSISGPLNRMSKARTRPLLLSLRRACDTISKGLRL